MTRRKQLLHLGFLLAVFSTQFGVFIWKYWPAQPVHLHSRMEILGTWKSEEQQKTDIQITFWRSGDFQVTKTFERNAKAILVKGIGSWVLRNNNLELSIESSEPPGFEGQSSWRILAVDQAKLFFEPGGQGFDVEGNSKGPKTKVNQTVLVKISRADEVFDSPFTLSFSGSSEDLARTLIVPTLQSQLPDGKSAIWCATLAMAWQQLERDALKESVALDGDEKMSRDLSDAPDAKLLPEHYYVAAGFHEDGIMDRIRRELPARFPKAPLPGKHLTAAFKPGTALAYAYLETSIHFQFAFEDIDQPLGFKDTQGKATSVRAFGIREIDRDQGENTYRKQVAVLFRKGDEFALDLSNTTRPYQIVVARMTKRATLRETLALLDKRIADGPAPVFGKGAILGIPNMYWQLNHHFRELENKTLLNPALPWGSFFQEVAQSINFRLDRRGAVLRSSGIVGTDWNGSHPEDYRFDRPFLIVLRNRDCPQPFFVMWVENAELLQRQ